MSAAYELFRDATAMRIRFSIAENGRLRVDVPRGVVPLTLGLKLEANRDALRALWPEFSDVYALLARHLEDYLASLSAHVASAKPYPPPLPPFSDPPARAVAWSAWWDTVEQLRIRGRPN